MGLNKKIETLKEKINEVDLIQDHLMELNDKNIELENRIENLNNQLESKNNLFRLYSSKFLETVYGKYSKNRISRVEKLKKDYLEIALEVKDYEKLSQSLNFQKQVLEEKVEQREKYIKHLSILLEHENISDINGDFEGKEKIKSLSAFLEYKETLSENLIHYIDGINEILKTVKSINTEVSADLNVENNSISPSSILPTFSTLVNDDLESSLNSFKKIDTELRKWSIEFDNLVFSNSSISKELKQLVSLELSTQINSGRTLYTDELSFLLANFLKNIFHFKSLLVLEFEISQKDIVNIKDEQLDIIWNWIMKK